MFIGEISCLVFLKCLELADRRRSADDAADRPLMPRDGSDSEGGGLIAFTALDDRHEQQQQEEAAAEEKPPVKNFALFVPAMMDVLGSFLVFVALRLTPPSTFMMLRCMNVPFTALASSVVTKSMPPRHKIIGIVVVSLAVLTVGYASTLNVETEKENRLVLSSRIIRDDDKNASARSDESVPDEILGGALILLSSATTAGQMVWEENVFRTTNASPLYMVGMEGVFGLAATSILLGVSLLLGRGDSAAKAVEDFRQDEIILGFILINTLCVAFLNSLGATVTKNLSAAHRSILDASRIALVWSFSMAFGWEKEVNALQIFGFFFLILGVAVFNNLVPRIGGGVATVAPA